MCLLATDVSPVSAFFPRGDAVKVMIEMRTKNAKCTDQYTHRNSCDDRDEFEGPFTAPGAATLERDNEAAAFMCQLKKWVDE